MEMSQTCENVTPDVSASKLCVYYTFTIVWNIWENTNSVFDWEVQADYMINQKKRLVVCLDAQLKFQHPSSRSLDVY